MIFYDISYNPQVERQAEDRHGSPLSPSLFVCNRHRCYRGILSLSLSAVSISVFLFCPLVSISYSYLWRFAIQLATGRVHRLGQEKDVEIIKLITSHTIDQHILRMAMHKKKLSEVMLTEVLSPIYIQLQCLCAFTLSIFRNNIH